MNHVMTRAKLKEEINNLQLSNKKLKLEIKAIESQMLDVKKYVVDKISTGQNRSMTIVREEINQNR